MREWLKQQGYAILPASLIDNGGAPLLESRDGKIILPNNLTWKNKEMGWVEVKTKSNATEHIAPPRRWEHGLPKRHWMAYWRIQEQTGIPVTLAVLELSTALLLIARIEVLGWHSRQYPMQGEMHVFLLRNDFERHDIKGLGPLLPIGIAPSAVRTRCQNLPPVSEQIRMM